MCYAALNGQSYLDLNRKISAHLSCRIFAPVPSYLPLLRALREANQLAKPTSTDPKHRVGVELFEALNRRIACFKQIQDKKLQDYLDLENKTDFLRRELTVIKKTIENDKYRAYQDQQNVNNLLFIENMVEFETFCSQHKNNPDNYFFTKNCHMSEEYKNQLMKLCKNEYKPQEEGGYFQVFGSHYQAFAGKDLETVLNWKKIQKERIAQYKEDQQERNRQVTRLATEQDRARFAITKKCIARLIKEELFSEQ